jgi:hypothetical protein
MSGAAGQKLQFDRIVGSISALSTPRGNAKFKNHTRDQGTIQMFILRDPMFYVCMITSVTVIYLTALAGSGRDTSVEEGQRP